MSVRLKHYYNIAIHRIKRLSGNAFIDLRNSPISPLEAMYRFKSVQECLLQAPTNRCRAFGPMGYKCIPAAGHPYIMAVEAYLMNNSKEQCVKVLADYYERNRPKTASELFNLPFQNVVLRELPALQAEVPWREHSGDKVQERRRRQSVKEMSCSLEEISLYGETNIFGPVTSQRIEVECARLLAVTESIINNGYRSGYANSEHVTGWLLVNESNEWIVDIAGGKHRIAVLTALGYEKVPVVFTSKRLVFRDRAHNWPGVKSGQFTVKEAQRIFDNIYIGRC